jgi:hypothetical protein
MMSRQECLEWEMICRGRIDDAFKEITAAIVTVPGVKMVLIDKTRQHKLISSQNSFGCGVWSS